MKVLLLYLLYSIDVSLGKPTHANASVISYSHEVFSDLYPIDCQELWDKGRRKDGTYIIYPQGPQHAVPVYCDMKTNNLVWTVFQKRFNGSVDFNQDWDSYVKGFGNADGEYWLGLLNIYYLTMKGDYNLLVHLEDFEGNEASAVYSKFGLSRSALNPEQDGYRLYVSDFIDNGAGDSLSYHAGHMFSTFDKDQDNSVQNCAKYWGGGFWYTEDGCAMAGLNAHYVTPKQNPVLHPTFSWIPWVDYPEALKSSEMKMSRTQTNN
ncbi:microfibril-associated glycoprotein 4 [Bombina bombina]|uniref:microfibril-associated glycoprotein 4 n=1 Tax=Bombina bombina TaxID=8345 RepID=UPI00235AFEAC|nr:microfibril-associated glycoprotein 4 [Bombina bombina]